jgi:hypothetical protein
MNETSAFRALAAPRRTRPTARQLSGAFASTSLRSRLDPTGVDRLYYHVWTALPSLVLLSCMQYYNRTQLSLAKDARFHVQFRPLGEFYRGKFSGASTTTTSGL